MSNGLPILLDENFDNDILRGVFRRLPKADLIRVQDSGLAGHDDASVLDYAAKSCRVLITHDLSTMTPFALSRIERGLRMPGLFSTASGRPNRTRDRDDRSTL